MAGIFSLRNWVMKQLMKPDKSGIMKIPPKGKVDFGEMLLREQLFQKGIHPKMIKNEKQLDNIINTPAVPKSERVHPKKPGNVIEVDFDKGRWKKQGGGAIAFPEEETQSSFAPGKVLSTLGRLAQLGITIGSGGIIADPKKVISNVGKQIIGKKIIKPVIVKGLEKAHGGGGGGTSIGGGQQTSQGIAGGAISHSAAKEARGGMSGWKLAQGGRAGLSYLLAEDTNERMPLALGKIVKGGNWFLKSLRGTREAIKKNKEYSPEQINLFLKQIDDQIKNIEAGGKIPDEVIQTIRSDPKFKSVWQNQLSADPDLREMEEVLLEYGQKHSEGGRIGLKDGHSPGRRKFLKVAAGLASIPVVGKFFKWAKPAAKVADVASVPIKAGADGMPAWFTPLVNRVIKEGDDVTKKFATKEREIVHKKRLGDPEDVYADDITVTQDLDTGNVRVEYHSSTNMGEAPIQLDYKAAEVIEPDLATGKGGGKIKEEFTAVESEPRVANWDGDIEWDGENVVGKVDDLLSDTTKLETYATGKKPTIKKLLKSEQKQKRVQRLHEDQGNQIDYIETKYGPGPDPTDFDDWPTPEYASGGLARMLGE